jgi:hypothetical protein
MISTRTRTSGWAATQHAHERRRGVNGQQGGVGRRGVLTEIYRGDFRGIDGIEVDRDVDQALARQLCVEPIPELGAAHPGQPRGVERSHTVPDRQAGGRAGRRGWRRHRILICSRSEPAEIPLRSHMILAVP